ncbi:hypothetical protein IMY05_C4635000600 [Salix suchowensis]|nr:hypothetical protein IMY05_C4635000600 [Salix suchowensis]
MSTPIKPSKAGTKRRRSRITYEDDNDEYEDKSFKRQDANAPPWSMHFMQGLSKKHDSPPAKRTRQTRQATVQPEMADNGIYDPLTSQSLTEQMSWSNYGHGLKGLIPKKRMSQWKGKKVDSWLFLEKELEQLPLSPSHIIDEAVSEEVPKTPQQTRRYGQPTRFLSIPPTDLQEDSSPGNDEIMVKKKPIMEEITVRRNANIPVKKPTVGGKPNSPKVLQAKNYPVIQSIRRQAPSISRLGLPVNGTRRHVSLVSTSSTSTSSTQQDPIEPSIWLARLASRLRKWADSSDWTIILEWLSDRENQCSSKALSGIPADSIEQLLPLIKKLAQQLIDLKAKGQSPDEEHLCGINSSLYPLSHFLTGYDILIQSNGGRLPWTHEYLMSDHFGWLAAKLFSVCCSAASLSPELHLRIGPCEILQYNDMPGCSPFEVSPNAVFYRFSLVTTRKHPKLRSVYDPEKDRQRYCSCCSKWYHERCMKKAPAGLDSGVDSALDGPEYALLASPIVRGGENRSVRTHVLGRWLDLGRL